VCEHYSVRATRRTEHASRPASDQSATCILRVRVTNAALDQLPEAAVQWLSNLPTTGDRQATLETLLEAVSIPLFWVIPVALTPAHEPGVAACNTDLDDAAVGRKLAAAVIPAAVGTLIGVLVLWVMTVLARSPLYPRMLIADRDWLFSLLVVATRSALHRGGGGTAVDACEQLSGGLSVERFDCASHCPGAHPGVGFYVSGDRRRVRLRRHAVCDSRRRCRGLGRSALRPRAAAQTTLIDRLQDHLIGAQRSSWPAPARRRATGFAWASRLTGVRRGGGSGGNPNTG
jgi:hypothetical protein